jgi:hypothetical protein
MEILGLVAASSLLVFAATAMSGSEFDLRVFVFEVAAVVGVCGLVLVLI